MGQVRTDRSRQVRVEYDGIAPLGRVVGELGIAACNTVVVVGSAASFKAADENRLERLLQRGLADVCGDVETAIVYGGTDSGVMRLVGRAIAEFAPDSPCVGVAPKGKVLFDGDTGDPEGAPPDPHHTHFVLAPPGAWASEASVLVGVAERLAAGKRLAMVVIGGGDGTRTETELAFERGWPLLAVAGIHGIGQDIAERVVTAKAMNSKGVRVAEPDDLLAASIDAGSLETVPLNDVHGFRRALGWSVSDDDLLKEAWLRYAQVDHGATDARPGLRLLKLLLLALGVVTTAMSIVVGGLPERLIGMGSAALVLLTSISGALVAFMARRRRDARWISLRAGAGALGREIYRYRTHAGPYWRVENDERRLLLASSLASIDGRLAGESALGARPKGFATWPPTFTQSVIDPADDLLRKLDGVTYDAVRVEDQIRYFTEEFDGVNRRINQLLIAVYGAGVVASVLGALAASKPHLGSWVAFVVAIAAAVLAWLDSEQLEQRSAQMALSCASIRAARERWLSLGPASDPDASRARVSRFAGEVEESLEAEAIQWERALRQAHQSFQAAVRPAS